MQRVAFTLVAVFALAVGVARGGSQLPLPCGLPQAAPLWVDYADGMVPFWSTIFAHPGVVGAASNELVPPQLRAKGAQTVYFDLHLNNRIGTPSSPADPSTVQARADKLFAAAVVSSGCDHPLIAENELSGADLPTPWTTTTAQYRANVLAYVQRLAADGARPFLLLPRRPYTHDEDADQWWRDAAQSADLVPEVYFSGPAVAKQGAVAGSRHLRATMRRRLEDLIQIGVPTDRLGMMLTFSSTPKAGGREGLQPLSKWLDVVKWEALAAKQVAGELGIASVWSWGWATFNVAGDDPDKAKAACTWLWTRDHALCDAPALDGTDLDPSLDVGLTLPAGTLCVLGKTRLLADDVAAIAHLTRDRDVAYSAELQHAVLVEANAVDASLVARAEVDTILDHFGGSRSAYVQALARAGASRHLARIVLADELRRRSIEATLLVPLPSGAAMQAFYATYAATNARAVRTSQPVAWLAHERHGVAIAGEAPGRIFALPSSATVTVDGVRVTALGETAPLGSFPFSQALPAIRRALLEQARGEAFAVWLRRRENQSLAALTCQHDRNPQPAAVDLTDWLPFVAIG